MDVKPLPSPLLISLPLLSIVSCIFDIVVEHNVDKKKFNFEKKKCPSLGLDPAIFWIEDPSLTG